MLKDIQASKMFTMLRNGCAVAEIARRLPVSEKTIRAYRDKDLLPSQVERAPRTHRTRLDPLEAFWPEVEALLESDPRLKPITLLGWLQQKHNLPGCDPSELAVPDTLRRTLERRVHKWRLQHDIEQDVMFPQDHRPGELMAFDFVDLNCLSVTIKGKPFEHKLFHAVLTYSNWEHLHLCYSESYEAVATGLQDALHRAGGVPQRVRSDSLSAAVNNLSSDKQFAQQYEALLKHYGLTGHRINVRKPHENGDVESSNGHIKTAIDQALRLRGNREFEDVGGYSEFVQSVVATRNAKRVVKLRAEVEQMAALPPQRMAIFTSLDVHVKSDCIITIKRNQYSVSSKYRGLRLEVHIQQDSVELWYRGERMEVMPRLFGRNKELINFRHVIDSLVRKPGAFANYRYQSHLYPTTRFRLAYDTLLKNTTELSAVKQYLRILHAAKHEGLDTVDEILQSLLTSGGEMTAAAVLALIASGQQIPSPLEMDIDPPDLNEFDDLLLDKEAYNDQEAIDPSSQFAPNADSEGGYEIRLDDYDDDLGLTSTTQGTASADDPRDAHSSGRPSGARSVVALAVPSRTDSQGVRVTESKSSSAADEKLALTGGQNLGAISMVSVTIACNPTARDSAERIVPGSTGQRVDFRQPGLGENNAAFRAGGSTHSAGSLGTVHDLSDVGAGTAPSQARSSHGALDQEAEQVRSADHRRPGVCATEPRRDGGVVHAAVGALRARKRSLELESTVQQMGTDLQRSDDDRCGGRPSGPPLCDHRAEDQELSVGRSKSEISSAFTWFQGYQTCDLGFTQTTEF